MHVVEISRVTPALNSDTVLNSATSLAIPLTFFDIPWLVFNPVTRLFFYRLTTDSTREHFHSFILPKLKLSLSHVLGYYLPLSGRITWAQNEPKPTIIVSQNDAVTLTIAETDSDFSLLSSYGQRPASELHSLLPELPVSDDSATALSLQITLFPDQGFSIGVAAHHAVLDGKTSTMFIKAWAHLCKQQHLEEENSVLFSLPKTLTPFLDRSLLKDQTGLDEEMVKIVRTLKQDKTNTSKSLSPIPAWETGDDVVFATLVLSRSDVERLRERVKNPSQLLHLSTFVVSYAYVWTCLVKARGGDDMERPVSFLFVADFRERLDPPLPANYFGNCMFPAGSYNGKTAGDFAGEGGFVTAVEILSGLVRGLGSRKIENVAEEFKISFDCLGVTSQFGSLAGSTRLGVYESDFGWGRPVKVDVVSIEGDRISMAERRDESGGIELGVCMKKAELDMVMTLFYNGLQN